MIEKFTFLQYRDFVWRAKKVVKEDGILLENTEISLPVPITDIFNQENVIPNLLTFIYTFEINEDEEKEIFEPYAYLQLGLDGSIIKRKVFRANQERKMIGDRFRGLANEMDTEEQENFVETYYELLTSDEGPVWNSWSNVNELIVQDLNILFYSMVEYQFLPLYKKYANEFLNFIGAEKNRLSLGF